jgi:hypothetical protein
LINNLGFSWVAILRCIIWLSSVITFIIHSSFTLLRWSLSCLLDEIFSSNHIRFL